MSRTAGRPKGSAAKRETTPASQIHRYTVILEREEDGGYHAFCPVLKGCHTQGDTLDAALANIREAIAAYVESLQKHGEPFPAEDILVGAGVGIGVARQRGR